MSQIEATRVADKNEDGIFGVTKLGGGGWKIETCPQSPLLWRGEGREKNTERTSHAARS